MTSRFYSKKAQHFLRKLIDHEVEKRCRRLQSINVISSMVSRKNIFWGQFVSSQIRHLSWSQSVWIKGTEFLKSLRYFDWDHSRRILQEKTRWVLYLELFLTKLAFDAKEILLTRFRRESLKFKYWRGSFDLIRFKERTGGASGEVEDMPSDTCHYVIFRPLVAVTSN